MKRSACKACNADRDGQTAYGPHTCQPKAGDAFEAQTPATVEHVGAVITETTERGPRACTCHTPRPNNGPAATHAPGWCYTCGGWVD